jgi:hypothetical protein
MMPMAEIKAVTPQADPHRPNPDGKIQSSKNQVPSCQ